MQKKILLVEDKILVAMMLAKKIEARGYQIIGPAVNAREAIDLALAEPPDLLFMDITLAGEMDGIEAAAHIYRKKPLPVIFFTGAHLDEGLMQRMAVIPGARFFDKLGEFDTVLEAIDQAINLGA